MARFLAGVVAVFGCGALVVTGCSGSTFTEQGGSAAGTASAGSPGGGSGNAGSPSSGGSESGGGTTDGGGTSGGSSSGGVASGGSSSGGVATGGSSSGGSGSGSVCRQDSDCVQCTFPTAPATTKDCYCTNCNYKPMQKDDCDANRKDYETVCANVNLLCPAIACIQPPTPRCANGMCVAGTK